MKVVAKTPTEIAKMKAAGKIASRVLELLMRQTKSGITAIELETIAVNEIRNAGGKPSFKGHGGYSYATCISINDEIVHGMPSSRKIQAGDVVGIDVGVFLNGYHSDTAATVLVENNDPEKVRLIETTKQSLKEGLKLVKPGIHLGDIQARIQEFVEKAGFSVIRDLAGHGIGKELQEDPSIPNFGKKGEGLVLQEGFTLAIEPMVAMGDYHVKIADDGWTVSTIDGSLAAHFEHTIAVTKDGYEILTK